LPFSQNDNNSARTITNDANRKKQTKGKAKPEQDDAFGRSVLKIKQKKRAGHACSDVC
jgi:hypothetical protein